MFRSRIKTGLVILIILLPITVIILSVPILAIIGGRHSSGVAVSSGLGGTVSVQYDGTDTTELVHVATGRGHIDKLHTRVDFIKSDYMAASYGAIVQNLIIGIPLLLALIYASVRFVRPKSKNQL